MSSSGQRFTDQQQAQMIGARRAALQGYVWLNTSARQSGQFLYQIIPKLHKYDEALRRAIKTRRNPA
eukprot:10307473-Alexandrium_andersonii.AAC.1